MNAISPSGRIGGRAPDVADFGEIQSIPDIPLEPKLRSQLKIEEEQVSLPQSVLSDSVAEALNTALGAWLTFDNPVWSGDPIPGLRALQKRLVEHALARQQGGRPECMASISGIERAVQLRLRWCRACRRLSCS